MSQTVCKAGSSGGDGGKTKKKENDSIQKHYPWLETFDAEAKAFLTVPHVTISHVLKLITLLEQHVSPEVTKLKTRPNRATKFLMQVRKKISIVKMGGLMVEADSEKDLYPTYGLLMTHVVNISLVSSKVEKLGAQHIATELYYFLKLMFQGDNEFVLDVVLCSTLDEQASSMNKVGFHLFSFIVEDWRLYNETHSSQMKYCAICSLLAEGCRDGQRVLDRSLSTEKVDKSFVQYLRRTLDYDFGEPSRKISYYLKEIVKHIKPTTVKSISRNRLVVVSKRDIAGGRREHSGSSDSSSTVNMGNYSNIGSVSRENPSSSSGYPQEDPMNQILGELGLGESFFLDTTGHDFEGNGSHNYYDDSTIGMELTSQNDQVSSSSARVRNSSSSTVDTVNIMKEKEEQKMDVDKESNDDEDEWNTYSDSIRKRKGLTGYSLASPDRCASPSSDDDSLAVHAPSPRKSLKLAASVSPGKTEVTPTGPRILEGKLVTKEEEEKIEKLEMNKKKWKIGNFELESDEEDEDDMSSDISSGIKTAPAPPEEDSDLEVLSVIASEGGDGEGAALESSDDSRSRDEEPADPEEDVVPNYFIDSDIEDDKGESPESVTTAPDDQCTDNAMDKDTQANDKQEKQTEIDEETQVIDMHEVQTVESEKSSEDSATSPNKDSNNDIKEDDDQMATIPTTIADNENHEGVTETGKDVSIDPVNAKDVTGSENTTERNVSKSPAKPKKNLTPIPSSPPSPRRRLRGGDKQVDDVKNAELKTPPPENIDSSISKAPSTRGRRKVKVIMSGGDAETSEFTPVRRSTRLTQKK